MRLHQWIFALALVLSGTQELLAQLSPLRSALSVGGAVKFQGNNNQRFSLYQSIGQSVIGLANTKGLLLRQGYIQPDFSLGVTNDLKLQAYVYPNPFSETITLSIKEDAGMLSLMVLDLMGRTVHLSSHDGEKEILLILSTLSSGMYIVRAQSGTKTFSALIQKE